MNTFFLKINWNDVLDLTWDRFLNYLLLLGICIIIYIFKYSAPSYLKKKGENLANKQDLEELTKIVKGVEQTFTDKTEILKLQLEISKEIVVGLHSHEIVALTEYHAAIHLYFDKLNDPDIDNVDLENYQAIDSYKMVIWKYYSDINVKRANCSLFIDDRVLLLEANTLVRTIMQNKFPIFLKFLNGLQDAITEFPDLTLGQDFDAYFDRRHILLQQFQNETIGVNGEIINQMESLSNSFREYLKKHLK